MFFQAAAFAGDDFFVIFYLGAWILRLSLTAGLAVYKIPERT